MAQNDHSLRINDPASSAAIQNARTLRFQGQHQAAIDMLLAANITRAEKPLWSRELAEASLSCGNMDAASRATQEMIASAVDDATLMSAGLALSEDRLSEAEPVLRARLREYPADVIAIRMMAELATRLGRLDDAERLLLRALDLAPSFAAARELLARNLQRANRPGEALVHVGVLLEDEPDHPSYLMLQASLMVKTGDQSGARDVYLKVLAKHPNHAKTWMSLGHVLKTLGQRQEGIGAYRSALEKEPTLGEAWWSLANLKTFTFSDADIATMEAALGQLERQSGNEEDRLHLHFALGKAREDRAEYDAAFGHWQSGNSLRRQSLPYDAEATHRECEAAKAFFDHRRLAGNTGCRAADPIFILGLPRAGSTLLEQILASHSQVEGTMELPDILAITDRLKGYRDGGSYLAALDNLTPDDLSSLGEEYLQRTRIHRRENKPFFIDKMPNNWLHVGFIRTILPNARIIDARRNAADCCLSAFKQHFARGQGFSYDLTDLGRYYRDYVDLMEHFEDAAPGMVHRVEYERMVSDTEAEVRALLDYCGLPFEAECLKFWENGRAVRTASSEQVRQPIFASGIGHWRHFERHLGPLFAALGPELSPTHNS